MPPVLLGVGFFKGIPIPAFARKSSLSPATEEANEKRYNNDQSSNQGHNTDPILSPSTSDND
jgi:hypothetical protein